MLDFGLAKALSDEPASEDVSKSPTLSMAATRQGVILGTAAYMAPEQAKGKTVDRRADVWAFGAVLYEMLTGQQAFPGEDVTEILAAVVRAEPDWNWLPANTSAAIRTLLRRCLAKDVRQRLQHIGEARFALEHVGDAPAEAVLAQGGGAFGRRALLLALGCLLVGIIVAGLAVWNLKPAPARPAQPVSRVVIPLSLNEQLANNTGTLLALSVDGTQLAYVAGSSQRIYLRAFDALEAKPLPGTEGAQSPFFSPDGQWIGFFAAGKLKKVSVNGGTVLTLCDAPNSRGGAWGANDIIVFAPLNVGSLSQVSAAGGAPQPLTKLKESEFSHRWPQFLPDGKTVLYAIGPGGSDDTQIAAYRLNTGEQKVVIRGGTYPWYVPTGHLVYYRAGTIMAVPFDTARLAVLGTPAPVIEGVMSSTGNALGAQFSISSRGSLVYVSGGPEGGAELTLVWVDRKGLAQPLPASPHAYGNPRLSPDGRQVALDITEGGKEDIWIYDLARDALTRLTFEGFNSFPVWTPDGKRVAYRSQRAGGYNMYWTPADGSGAEERLTTAAGGWNLTPSSFSPDGRALVYNQTDPKTSYDLWMLPMQGERKPQPFLQTPFNERAPRLSPDGRWLAYVSDESGRYEVYVRPFPRSGRQVAGFHRWSRRNYVVSQGQ